MSSIEPIKCLLVDDLKKNLVALEALVRFDGAKIFSAGSGREALELLLRHEFALAIIDVQMPEMDGFELAELMRGSERTCTVPIMFVTAGARSRDRTFQGYESGAVDFLYKPLDPAIVRNKVHVFYDLARQKKLLEAQLEATREALRVRDDFLSVASHELRTPLATLKLQIQIISRYLAKSSVNGLSDERLSTMLRISDRQISALNRLVDDLLDVSRIAQGQLALNVAEADLAAIAREVIELFSVEAEAKEISIRLEADGVVRGNWDEARIQQVAVNLLSNAIKYGDGKSVEVVVASCEGFACLSVRDHGIGIPKERHGIIFERFERADTESAVSGLGLGLFIADEIVKAHGGRIEVESEPRAGSVFTVHLPVRAARVRELRWREVAEG